MQFASFPVMIFYLDIVSGINIRFRAICPLAAIRSMSMPISSSFSATEEVEQVKLLTAVNDDYEGVIAELKEPMEPITFVSALRASMTHWREQVDSF